MTHHQINFIGWVAFVIPDFGFCIASLRSGGAMPEAAFIGANCSSVISAPFVRRKK